VRKYLQKQQTGGVNASRNHDVEDAYE
jgi:hypothetical protein